MSIFDTFKRTNVTKKPRHLPIDWCPRCGKIFSDDLESTKIEHDELNHAKTRKERIIYYTKSHIISFIFIFIAVAVLFTFLNSFDSVKTECDIIGDEFADKYSDTLLSNIPNEDIIALENACAKENYKIWVGKRFDGGVRDQLINELFD